MDGARRYVRGRPESAGAVSCPDWGRAWPGGRTLAQLIGRGGAQRSRLIYRSRIHRGRKGERKGFTWRDYRDLIVAARRQLGGPIVLVWDNLAVHRMPRLAAFFEANAAWLTVVHLPAYAPDLNPQEGVWPLLKRSLGNLAAASVDHLATTVIHRLKTIQRRPHLIDACLTQTGLALDKA
ncbi:transposase [Streptomyces mayteni]